VINIKNGDIPFSMTVGEKCPASFEGNYWNLTGTGLCDSFKTK
jgi:hypothetical protein